MKAKVTKSFAGVPDGEIYPREIQKGEIVAGELAAIAVREGWAKKVEGDEPPAPPAPQLPEGFTVAEGGGVLNDKGEPVAESVEAFLAAAAAQA